ncbi:MAG: class I SAM-dependent methyltransferase [Actinomycetota bacterium]|nr:class I SAM-dependent methyltransferase [Actinomycetota bacterium]
MMASEYWAEALATWAIPAEILDQAPESPWGFAPGMFAAVTRDTLARPTPTHRRAVEGMPEHAVVLDVGAGTGAASLPLAPPAGRIVAVDQSQAMLDEMARLAGDRVSIQTIVGRWPDVSDQVEPVDVAVCANVAYNVANLDRFAGALTEATRGRVVMELTSVHPQSALAPLWRHFWQLERPTTPTADDARNVIRETLGVEVQSERWSRHHPLGRADDDAVASIRRRLCLSPSADAEIAELLESMGQWRPTGMVTMWWPGRA